MKRWLFVLLMPALALAAVPWSREEVIRNSRTFAPGVPIPCTGKMPVLHRFPTRHDYLSEIKQTCDFVARYQFSDSSKPDSFGGIIEAEHLPTIIETDNTQEAIWIWTRWYELTGYDDYRTNIRRAWYYVLRHPAYREGVGQYVWYSVWNCGLGFFAETKYRQVYRDSQYLAYPDTCRQYCFSHPLDFSANPVHGNVTALAAGMMYRYALDRGDAALRDTALAYGNRVRVRVEAQPSCLRTGQWAMSGGTILWGLCNSVWREDTAAGKAWLSIYADSLPYFMPSGAWNCSWNVWDANGFRATRDINHENRFAAYHQHLTDTLLGKDEDDDGGIPATWTDPQNQDQTWVSSYLDFMGMDTLAAPIYDSDAAVLDILGIDPNRVYLPGDTLSLAVVVANCGRTAITFDLTLRLPGYSNTVSVLLPYLAFDTVPFTPPQTVPSPGIVPVLAFAQGDQNWANDTIAETLRVWTPRNVTGFVRDSITAQPIRSRLEFCLLGDSLPFRIAQTDSLGFFRTSGLDTSFNVDVYSELPYPDRHWLVRIRSDTLLEFRISPAHLLLVDNDSLARYEDYYTSTFDTLSLSYCLWRRRSQGPFVAAPLNHLQDKLVVWFTGATVARTLDTSDMTTLSQFLDVGGRLFITGQNIGQELAATPFYRDRVHARLVNPTISQVYLYGDRLDSLGGFFGQTQSAGTSGANNQNSRDEIAPDSLARAFLLYDTLAASSLARSISGIYYHDPINDSRIIYLGFGFEAVNRPINHPTFMSRVTFFDWCRAWLTGATGLTQEFMSSRVPGFQVSPNPFRHSVRFVGDVGVSEGKICIYSVAGRLVRVLRLSGTNSGSQLPPSFYWDATGQDGRLLPAGVYIYQIVGGPTKHVGAIQLIR
jgi:hypothetical protein